MKYESISILGCGWFGLPLAIELKKQGYLVKGSAQTIEKTNYLKTIDIDAFQIYLGTEKSVLDPAFFNSDLLLINIPPARRDDIVVYYSNLMNLLLPYVVSAKNLKGVIFISSTSVYPDLDQIMNEDCFEKPDKSSGLALLVAENFLAKNIRVPVTILRFAGLIGAERSPAKFLAGKKELKRGNAPVNLIHQTDCISATIEVMKQPIQNEIYNICSDNHPSRKEYYTATALKANLEPPTFLEEEQPTKGKKISNQKFKNKFPQWQIRHNDLT